MSTERQNPFAAVRFAPNETCNMQWQGLKCGRYKGHGSYHGAYDPETGAIRTWTDAATKNLKGG